MPCRAALSSVAVLVAAGCAQTAPPDPQDLRSQRIARLELIARGCGLPAEALKLEGWDELHVQPPENATYDSLDCVFKALEKAGMPLKMGFVGRESYQTENAQ